MAGSLRVGYVAGLSLHLAPSDPLRNPAFASRPTSPHPPPLTQFPANFTRPATSDGLAAGGVVPPSAKPVKRRRAPPPLVGWLPAGVRETCREWHEQRGNKV